MSSPVHTQKFNILVPSNIFCNKTVLNRFSSCSLKPRCIIGLPVTFLLIAIIPSILHLWRHLYRPGLISAQPTTFLNRFTISVAISVYGSFKDWENTIRPAVVELLPCVGIGGQFGIDCTTNFGRAVFTLLEVNLTLPSIIYSFTAQSWFMVDVKHSIDLGRVAPSNGVDLVEVSFERNRGNDGGIADS